MYNNMTVLTEYSCLQYHALMVLRAFTATYSHGSRHMVTKKRTKKTNYTVEEELQKKCHEGDKNKRQVHNEQTDEEARNQRDD